MHSRASESSIREVAPSTGGLCGGTFVDDRFFDTVRACMPGFEAWKAEKPAMFFKITSNWETSKRSFSGKELGSIALDMPQPIIKAFAQRDGHETEEDEEEEEQDGIVFTVAQLQQFFDPVVDQIISLVRAQIAKVPDIQCIIFVGGFSSSPYLRHRVKAACATPTRPMFTVAQAAEAIVSGAVLLGLSDWFSTRCMKRTYGVAVAGAVLPTDPPADIHMINGAPKCLTRFHVFVSAGEEIPIDKVVSKKYRRDRQDSDLCINLFSSATKHPSRVNQPDVQLLKEYTVRAVASCVLPPIMTFQIPLANQPHFGLEGVQIELFFGKTVMELVVVDLKTGVRLPAVRLAVTDS